MASAVCVTSPARRLQRRRAVRLPRSTSIADLSSQGISAPSTLLAARQRQPSSEPAPSVRSRPQSVGVAPTDDDDPAMTDEDETTTETRTTTSKRVISSGAHAAVY